MLKFLNVLAALAAVGSFVIAFFDSYEVRFKVRRRTRGADGRRHLRRACKLKCPWFGVRTFNNTGNWSPALSNTYAGRIVSCIDSIPHRPADSGHFENSNTPDNAVRLRCSRGRM